MATDTETKTETAEGGQKWTRARVPLSKIVRDASLQVRGEIDMERVAAYRDIIREQGWMDPISLFQETRSAPLLNADGFHRLAAYEAEGTVEIPCRVQVGTKSDALKFALKENGHHGAQMSNAQKRHAAELAVVDAVLAELTDKSIAKLIGCSASLVGQARRGEKPEHAAAKRQERQAPAAESPAASPTVGPAGSPERPGAGRSTSRSSGVESSAPPSARAREPKTADRPTKAMLLKQIQDWVDKDMLDEADVVELFATASGAYAFAGKPGAKAMLKVVGKTGRVQVEVPIIVRQIAYEQIHVKFDEGKLKLVEPEE